jgi:hypothetical protein
MGEAILQAPPASRLTICVYPSEASFTRCEKRNHTYSLLLRGKMRTSNHDKGVFEYVIDSQGLTIKARLEWGTGVLGWSVLRSKS